MTENHSNDLDPNRVDLDRSSPKKQDGNEIERSLPENRLWDVQDVAYYLRISPQTIYRKVSEGELKADTTFGRLRFRPDYIKNSKHGRKRRRSR